GDDTLVAEPGGVVAVSRGGSPALATAGTGDVLSGVIAAGLSQRLDPFTAAAAGVLLHARAGRLAAPPGRRPPGGHPRGCARSAAGEVCKAPGPARGHDEGGALGRGARGRAERGGAGGRVSPPGRWSATAPACAASCPRA